MDGTGTEPSLSEQVERSPVAQILISIVIVLVLLAEIGSHLPPGSAMFDLVGDESNSLIRAVATEQQWGVFAPDPRQTSLRLEGRVTFADGTTAVWHLPQGARIGANFRYYRWRKWLERVRSDDFRSLWAPTARWVAGLYADRPSPVARVELVRLFHQNALVGEQPPYQEFTYCTYVPAEGEGCA